MDTQQAIKDFFDRNKPKTDLEYLTLQQNFQQNGYTEVGESEGKWLLGSCTVIGVVNPSTQRTVYYAKLPRGYSRSPTGHLYQPHPKPRSSKPVKSSVTRGEDYSLIK